MSPQSISFDALATGDAQSRTRTLRAADVAVFERGGGEFDSQWYARLALATLAQWLPDARVMAQSFEFDVGSNIGDAVSVRLVVLEKDVSTRTLRLTCTFTDEGGRQRAHGQLRVCLLADSAPPVAEVHEAGRCHRRLLEAAATYPPIATAVVHPCDDLSLRGALEAANEGLIRPVLVGPLAKIRACAESAAITLDGIELVDAPHSHAAAAQAVALARAGRVDALMKGALHTDELMEAVVDGVTGLRTERRISHVFALDVPTYPKPLFITDAAINIAPSLMDKRDIVQNAIDLVHALDIAWPNVAILSAVETVNPKIASTIDAAALCKMLDRGQISGARVDGPLAFDNAISRVAAKAKAIDSDVAGNADILVVPDLESGNMLVKQLIYLSGADVAGIVLGARVPIMLTSRADAMPARLASAALALLLVHRRSGAR